jgi:DNA-binding NtrC family response regulator
MRNSVVLVMRHSAERLMYGDMLDRDGFQTTRLSTPSQARAAIDGTLPDVLMVGLDDAHEEAIALVRWAKALRGQTLKVIAITTSPIVARSAQLAGCDDCIEVPAPIGEVVSAVQRSVA